jgi:hypothetical protein
VHTATSAPTGQSEYLLITVISYHGVAESPNASREPLSTTSWVSRVVLKPKVVTSESMRPHSRM